MDGITGVLCTPLRIIPGDAGAVLHGLKQSDAAFDGFGEVYFSIVAGGKVKGWKKHTRMRLNLVVTAGSIRFVLCDGRPEATTFRNFFEVTLSRENYQRLTVPPGVWMAFQGMTSGENMLLNLASIPHDPTEAETLPLQNAEIPFSFS